MDDLSTPSSGHHVNDSQSDDAPSPEVIVDTMMHTAYAFMRRIQARLCEHDWPGGQKLSFARGRLIDVLYDGGPRRMGDVAEQLGVTARTLTTTVDALEREGLVIRQPDPTDRRAILLTLGEGAHTLMEQFHRVGREASDEFLAPLDAAERRQFFDLLNHLEQKDPSNYPEDEDPRREVFCDEHLDEDEDGRRRGRGRSRWSS